ncbi:MAG TPA: hypothetical protein VN668_21245 [Stellaceae bacterium]|nr:hypothetical protein [Stellaceae bacterium]
MPRPLFPLLAGLLAAGTALAQTAPAPPGLARYLANAGHRRALIAAAERANEQMPGHCETVEITPGPLAAIERPARFDAVGRPVDGMWVEAVAVKGCGATRRFNIMTVAAPGRTPEETALLPGTTAAPPLTQRFGIAHAIGAASLHEKSCARFAVIDTRLDGPEEARAKGAWRETWTVWACGALIDVPVHFAPGKPRPELSVNPAEAVPRR